MIKQNDLEHILDLHQRGLITADEANVMKVQFQRVLVVTKLPPVVRRCLNAAVKRGELAHKKKDGALPEVYYHPKFEYLANYERNKALERKIEALKKVCI